MEYFTEFRKLFFWKPAAPTDHTRSKKVFLDAGLSVELQRCLIGRDMAGQTFDDYCTYLKLVSGRLEALNLRTRENRRPNNNLNGTNAKQTPSRYQEDMDREPTRTLRVHKTENNPPTNQSDNSGRRRATWVNQETMAYRMEKRLCLRCGNPGTCVQRPARARERSQLTWL